MNDTQIVIVGIVGTLLLQSTPMNDTQIVIVGIVGALLLVAAIAGVAFWLSRRGSTTTASPDVTVQPPTTPHVQVTYQDGATQQVSVPPNRPLTVGRNPENDVVVQSHLVSRQHARIYPEDNLWILEDLDSSNGTVYANRPVMGRERLHPDRPDMIEIGPVTIRLIVPGHVAVGYTNTPPPPQLTDIAQPGTAFDSERDQQRIGRYRIERQLGEGGMSRVLLGTDTTQPTRQVAIKLLNHPSDFLADKLRQEGSLRLKHPHIVQVYEAGEHNGRPYIVMEYLQGVSLRKLMPHGRPLPLPVALAVMAQMLDALSVAHARGIIHRDIKPANIMVSAEHGVKVIDFGIAKVLATVTRTQMGILLGTPQYMSYEQALGQPVNVTSDLYSAAIVLYEMLTGNIPFGGDDPMEIVRQHRQSLPMPPRDLRSDLPDYINDAILRALEKDDSKRFPSASAFLEALGCSGSEQVPPIFTAQATRLVTTTGAEGTPQPTDAGTSATPLPRPRSPGTITRLLRVSGGHKEGTTLTIGQAETIMGRENINIDDGTISRRHFAIRPSNDGQAVLHNLSANGTIVNDTPLKKDEMLPLVPGATIRVGNTTLVYEEH